MFVVGKKVVVVFDVKDCFYVVVVGFRLGIYIDWLDVVLMIVGVKGFKYK